MFVLYSVESTGSLLSLVKTFDSMLSVYEGFCNLKQVPIFKIFYFVSLIFLVNIFHFRLVRSCKLLFLILLFFSFFMKRRHLG